MTGTEKIGKTATPFHHNNVLSCLPLVHSLAHKYSPYTNIPYDDLYQAGCEGLCLATQTFNPEKGVAFSTYSYPWIKKYILREMNLGSNGCAAHIPLNLAETATTLRKERSSLLSSLGREPTEEELAERLRVPPSKIHEILSATQSAVSLDEPVGSTDDGGYAASLGETLWGASSPEEALLLQDTQETIRSIVSTLPEKEAKIITMRFGLDGAPSRSLEECGQALGLGKERVRQLQSSALRKLRNPKRLRYIQKNISKRSK